MRAHARIEARAGAGGATVLAELRGEPPLLPRVTGARGGPVAEVHLVGGAAGPLGGDELHLDVDVGPGACLVLRTVAASVALPGTGAPSTLTVRVRVAGSLVYRPEPTVAAAGCHHRMITVIDVCDGGRLWWRDEAVAGRHGEAPGRLHQSIRLRHAGAPLLAQDLELTPDGWSSPAIVGAARTVGNIVIVDPDRPQWSPTGTAESARMPLRGDAVLCSAVAPDITTLRRRLADLAPVTPPGS